MKLLLQKLPKDLLGIYDCDRDGIKKEMPFRALFAHPVLATAILSTEKDGFRLTYSDIFRDAKTSLARRREFVAKGGPQLAAKPGFSAHNFGFAVDLDVQKIMKDYSINKEHLDVLLRDKYSLYCHRRDHSLASECWHYNALGGGATALLQHSSKNSTSGAVEAFILSVYGKDFDITRDQCIQAIRALGFMPEKVDNAITEVAAIKKFQLFWDLQVDGILGPQCKRLLAYLTATTELVT